MLADGGYVRVKEAAEIMGVSPHTVRAWGAAGEIEEYRHPANNHRLYRRTDLERLLKQVETSASETKK